MRLSVAVLAASLAFTSAAFADDDHDHDRCHEIFHHATRNHVQNGAELVKLVSELTDASATHPYVIHLDAGVYTIASSLVLLPYVSLKGSGMTSTTLEPANDSIFTTVYFQDQVSPTYVAAPSNETLAGMTVIGIQPLSATVNGFLTIDHVQLISTNNWTSAIDLITSISHFFVTDSLLGSLQLASSTVAGAASSPVSSILSSEVDLDYAIVSSFKVVCMADYTVTGAAVPQACH